MILFKSSISACLDLACRSWPTYVDLSFQSLCEAVLVCFAILVLWGSYSVPTVLPAGAEVISWVIFCWGWGGHKGTVESQKTLGLGLSSHRVEGREMMVPSMLLLGWISLPAGVPVITQKQLGSGSQPADALGREKGFRFPTRSLTGFSFPGTTGERRNNKETQCCHSSVLELLSESIFFSS